MDGQVPTWLFVNFLLIQGFTHFESGPFSSTYVWGKMVIVIDPLAPNQELDFLRTDLERVQELEQTTIDKFFGKLQAYAAQNRPR